MTPTSTLMQQADDAWNARDWDAFESLHDSDCVVYWPGMQDTRRTACTTTTPKPRPSATPSPTTGYATSPMTSFSGTSSPAASSPALPAPSRSHGSCLTEQRSHRPAAASTSSTPPQPAGATDGSSRSTSFWDGATFPAPDRPGLEKPMRGITDNALPDWFAPAVGVRGVVPVSELPSDVAGNAHAAGAQVGDEAGGEWIGLAPASPR